MATARDLQFHAALSQAATAVEEALDKLLPPVGTPLADAMRHGTLSGGKRLRAFLVLESAGLFRVPKPQAIRAAAAVECIHAYSLIHDDLPAMDDDDMRRGQPTVHKLWDEATAILAGDALQSLAFEILAAPQTAPDPLIRTRLMLRLAQAAGAGGMVAGQALDIAAETAAAPLDFEQVAQLQALKTGALIGWSCEAGAILGKSDVSNLVKFAAELGLAFQIQDDILDVTAEASDMGKATHKDGAAGKATFVSLLGLEGARKKARDLVSTACDTLSPYGSAAENLRLAAEFAISRNN
ncbi:polyprenyl synthetase family protein [Halovulum dunhuangense]|uniref:Geranylgeranyl diphosphate synthase n=1 Tax=Halovulum dunhuangense TaxID=1505036 RepID=A0A849KZ68_9RHOB|nr:farnesyl diphosphate synthase [Halovulum dunhuangense]NNU79302.1 polyprenyl synthetase family protein [Halovulum dunhuangense]